MSTLHSLKAFILMGVLGIFLASCSENDSVSGNSISTEDAAEIIASGVAEETGGVTATITTSSEMADEAAESASDGRIEACGFENDSTIAFSSSAGTISYDYSFSYGYKLECDSKNAASAASFGVTYSGSFDAPRMYSGNSGSADLDVAGLDMSTTSFVFNGSFDKSGTFESKVRNKHTTLSVINLSLSDIKVDKSTYEIETGTATATLTGTVEGEGGFEFTATIEFLGDGDAKLTISGSTYTIDLESGDISAL